MKLASNAANVTRKIGNYLPTRDALLIALHDQHKKIDEQQKLIAEQHQKLDSKDELIDKKSIVISE